MRKKFSHKKTRRTDRKQKEFISRGPGKHLDFIKSDEMWKYKNQIIDENADLNSWNCIEIADEMEGSEEEMKQCLLIFSQILFPQYSDSLQFCIQGKEAGSKKISDPSNNSIGFMDEVDNNFGNEEDMKKCLLLFAQILYPQFQHCLQKLLIEEESLTKQTNRGEVSINGTNKTDDFFGSKEDMKQCLLLIAQILYPQFNQCLQECCGSETSGYSRGSAVLQDSENIEQQSAMNIFNDESYGNEEDMKQCLLLLAQALYPQFASCFQECLDNENAICSEEFPSYCSSNKDYKED
ncbi:hypothetical protein ACTXT7_003861 [Hymenolepis weldensis]